MTAQEWLDELERLRKAATPGPWSKSEQGTNETYHHRLQSYYTGKETPEHIAYVVLPNVFGNIDDAAYIAAACNAVPRLVEMLVLLASLASEDDESVDAIERRIQWAYNETRPKE
jgi:hypothetical protein